MSNKPFAVWKGEFLLQQTNSAALYYRLSRDDGGDAESNSIITQRQMLTRYAKEQGFTVYDEYVDDGISGTTFQRAGFLRMIRDIEGGKVNTVICKDLSRLGRDNPTVMYYTDTYFPEHAVRFISVCENFDSSRGENEFLPFMSVVNEMYARDCSKKIRAAYRTKAQGGEYCATYAPYGYMKNPDNPRQLIPDPNTAETVRRMFGMAAEGINPYRIARQFSDEGILTPRAYQFQTYGYYGSGHHMEYPTDWNNASVVSMLKNRVYLGHIVGCKSTTKSFKNRSVVQVPKEQWIEVRDIHAPLVDEATFERAWKMASQRKIENKAGIPNIFVGLLLCSGCNTKMAFIQPETPTHGGAYNCNMRRKRGKAHCSNHYIRFTSLYQIVLHDIQRHARLARQYENELSNYAQGLMAGQSKKNSMQKELDKFCKRERELGAIIQKLLEQNALGIITDERFAALYGGYETEQAQLSPKIADLRERLAQEDSQRDNMEKFLALIGRYFDITELNAVVLNDLIDCIVIHGPEGTGRKDRTQKVEIFYKFVGDLQGSGIGR